LRDVSTWGSRMKQTMVDAYGMEYFEKTWHAATDVFVDEVQRRNGELDLYKSVGCVLLFSFVIKDWGNAGHVMLPVYDCGEAIVGVEFKRKGVRYCRWHSLVGSRSVVFLILGCKLELAHKVQQVFEEILVIQDNIRFSKIKASFKLHVLKLFYIWLALDIPCGEYECIHHTL